MSTRSRKENKNYKKYLRKTGKKTCNFCEIDKNSDSFKEESKSFKIIKNIFSYSLWDGLKVDDHIMIVPKKHTDTLSDLNEHEAKEFVDILGKYESSGYNIYARAPSSVRKTIVHQHTHLIKTKGLVRRFIFAVYRPFYLRISR